MESYSLFQLNEYIRRVIALNFREPLWIEAEIIQCRESKGNYYIELVQKDEKSDKVLAQASAAIWYKNYQFIKRKLGDLVNDLLADGTELRIKCKIDYNERYGMKLFIEDIDPNYTFGKVELNRQKIIAQLQQEGLVDVNSSLEIPQVIQNVAVISSSNAAGYKDFIKQLENNSYGYKYNITLFDSAVQGVKVEGDTCKAIEQISSEPHKYHAAVIIRGGGSKLDLAGYDNYKIARSIAISGIPFIIGIGHDIDNTVADMVSAISVKTPTAVADLLVEKSLHYESTIEHLRKIIYQKSQIIISEKVNQTGLYKEQIRLLSMSNITSNVSELDRIRVAITQAYTNRINSETHSLEKYKIYMDSADPVNIMSKGYLYATKDSAVISTKKQLKSKDDIILHFHDGLVKSKIV